MDKPGKRSPLALWIGCIGSLAFLAFFLVLKWQDSALLGLPAQWLIAALVPVTVGLVAGGYIRGFTWGEFGVDIASPSELTNAQRIDDSSPGTPAKLIKELAPASWQAERAKKYAQNRHYMLAHMYRPSSEPGQKFDISIFVVRHQKGTPSPPQENLDEIDTAEFFFGESWGNKVYPVQGVNGFFGVRTHAWGTFLACCRVSFKDKAQDPVILFRYIDFFMAKGAQGT